MFIYSLSSRLDKLDPYWYGRLLALKAAYLTTGLFIANLILRPASPTVTMLMSAIGVLIAELPTINSLDKKDNIYLAWIILVSLTITIFSASSYFKLIFIIVVAAWAYFLYFMLRKKPELFAIVSALLMMGTISQEGLKIGNFFSTWNTLVFIFEFAIIAFWLHKLFPFLYHKIWLSSLLRSFEGLLELITVRDIKISKSLRQHSMVSLSSLNLLSKRHYYEQAQIIHENISALHIYFYNLIYTEENHDIDIEVTVKNLKYIYSAIINLQQCDLDTKTLGNVDDDYYHSKISELLSNWNALCVHVNN